MHPPRENVLFAIPETKPEGIGVPDTSPHSVHATQLIRKMHGGSQSILVRGNDERLYVVKLSDNQHGPNLLANEVLGSELLR